MTEKNLAIALPAEITCEQNVSPIQQQLPTNFAVADKPSFEDVAHIVRIHVP